MTHLLLAIIYLSFISLGLPDGLLGAAWPSMYDKLGVGVSCAGIISMIICVGTIVSSLMSDTITHKLGPGRVTVISVAMTAFALLGFSFSTRFWMLCLWAIPYGLGAGSVDAALNNYVAIHYSSKHMSWLHCMWGIGASTGPYIIGTLLTLGGSWNMGYLSIGVAQILLAGILLSSLPIWKGNGRICGPVSTSPMSLKQVVRIPGAWEVMVTFFCYCALEQTAGLWSASYLVLHMGFDSKLAASLASSFFLGMTLGRFASGFLTMRYRDTQLIRMGMTVIAAGILALMLPIGKWGALTGLLLIGLGCAPIYPCVIHSTPEQFGADRSQALIGIQMASAYVGTALMPPLFGLIADHISIRWLWAYLLILLMIMTATHERLIKKTVLSRL